MGTAPSGYQTPKTDWAVGNIPVASDFNRAEGNSKAIEEGSRTIDPAQTPTSNVGTLRQLLDWFANRIRAITGKTNWYDNPDITLATLATHKSRHASGGADALTPADIGAETPSGAQSKVDAHANLTTTAHGGIVASSDVVTTATANKILKLNAYAKLPASITGDADTVDGRHGSNLLDISNYTESVFTDIPKKPSQDGVWEDWNLHTEYGVPGNALAIIQISNNSSYAIRGGVRTNGSTVDRRAMFSPEGGGTWLVKTDVSGIVEIFADSRASSLYMYCIGYIK